MRHRVSPWTALLQAVCLAASLAAAGATPASAEGTPTSAAAVTVGDKKVPTTLLDIARRLDKLTDQIDALRKEARRDPDEGKITIYENYTHDDFKDRKRKVRAEDLVAFMLDTTKAKEVRDRAFKVLKDGTMHGDPDLSKDKKSSTTKRGWFTNKHLVNHLRDEDRDNREYTQKILDAWFYVRGVKVILDYDLDKPKTWKPALDAWKREIKKRR